MTAQATAATGLSEAEAARRRAVHGPNVLETGRRRAAVVQLLARFKNPLVLLLVVASSISALTGDYGSSFIIVGVVALSVVLDFVQEHRAGRAAERLRRSASVHATVVREGTSRDVPAEESCPATS